MDWWNWGYAVLGLGVGALGTIMGAGGGFILVPILLFLLPETSAAHIAAISMMAVAANAVSGSITYGLNKQIHWKCGWLFTLVTLPGVWIGLWLGRQVDRHYFELLFAFILLALAVFLMTKSKSKKYQQPPALSFQLTQKKLGIGAFISLGVGVFASFFGLGGGIIHVPLLAEFLNFPIHLATGTSQFILAITALVAVFGHMQANEYAHFEPFLGYLLVGIVAGAQVGAKLSPKIKSRRILQLLAVTLFLVSLHILWRRL